MTTPLTKKISQLPPGTPTDAGILVYVDPVDGVTKQTPASDLPNIPATDVSYDNTTSLLSATNAQQAIDELSSEKANDSGLVHTTGNETIAGVKTFTSPLITNGAINFNAPEGFMVNGKIVPSVGNLISNNSFETNLSGWSGWSSASFTRDTTEYYHGVASAKIVTDGNTYAQGCYSAVTTKVGSTYAYSCYVKGTAGKKIAMFIDGGTYPEIYQTLTGGWDRITGSVTATSTNTSIYIQCITAGVTTYWLDAVQVEEGTTVAGPFTTTQGNLTVAIKTLAGTDPSAIDPVYVRIGGVMRSITSALSLTKVSGTSYLNLGSAELATKEMDLFVYLRWDTGANAVCLDVSRIPYATRTGDFTKNDTGEKGYFVSSFAGSAVTDVEVNIGRFAATLSAGAGYTWSIPTYTASNLIQRPIYETRTVTGSNWLPTLTWNGTAPTGGTNKNFVYNLVGDKCYISGSVYNMTAGVANSLLTVTLPFTARGGAVNLQLINSMISAGTTPNLTMGDINYNSVSLSINCIPVNATYLQFQGFYNI